MKRVYVTLITFLLVGSFLGSLTAVLTQTTPTIYKKLNDCKANYYIAQWNPSILNDKTYVHQFRDFDEIVEIAGVMDLLGDPIMFFLDKTYNIIWRLDPTDEGWISLYFYTDPD